MKCRILTIFLSQTSTKMNEKNDEKSLKYISKKIRTFRCFLSKNKLPNWLCLKKEKLLASHLREILQRKDGKNISATAIRTIFNIFRYPKNLKTKKYKSHFWHKKQNVPTNSEPKHTINYTKIGGISEKTKTKETPQKPRKPLKKIPKKFKICQNFEVSKFQQNYNCKINPFLTKSYFWSTKCSETS